MNEAPKPSGERADLDPLETEVGVESEFRLWRGCSADESEIRALFERVFGHPMSSAEWHWKYGAGQGHSILARTHEGLLVAHYGAMLRRIGDQGETVTGLQIGDVMVDPAWRGNAGSSGLFYQVAAAFQRCFFADPSLFRVAYGFPNARAMRLAVRQRLYRPVDRLLELRWPVEISLWSRRLVALRRDWSALTSVAFSACSKAMHQDLHEAVWVLRDEDYLRYRYPDCPRGGYELIEVRLGLTRSPLGFAVLKREEDHVKLMDVVGGLNQTSRIIEGVRVYLSQAENKPLRAWVTPRQCAAFQAVGVEVHATDLQIPCQSLFQHSAPEQFYGRWWVSYGDTDFL